MNSFAHALPFLQQHDYYAIGCAIPDWLGAVDRRCRVRKHRASEFVKSDSAIESNIAAGIVQHIDDDRWFHQGERFTELSMEFAVELRDLLTSDPGFRPGFLGHIMIELLLDGYLHEVHPGALDTFYEMVANSNPDAIQDAVNEMATKPTDKLADYFPIFLKTRYLYDYVDNGRLLMRTNHVLKRVKLKPVNDEIINWVPNARDRVYESADELLYQYTGSLNPGN